MASDESVEDALRQLLKCHVCTELVDVLKVLPCQHPVCLPCAKQLPVLESRYHCPTCRQKHAVPNGGMGQLPNSLGLQRISDILNRKQKKFVPSKKKAAQLLVGGGGFGVVPTSTKGGRQKSKRQKRPKKVEGDNAKTPTAMKTEDKRLRDRLEKCVDAAAEWCIQANNKIALNEQTLESLPEQAEAALEVVSKYKEKMEGKCEEKLADATQAAADKENELKRLLEQVQTYLDTMEQMLCDVTQCLSNISADDNLSLGEVIEAQKLYYEMVKLNKAVRPPNLFDVSTAEEINDGDCVRLKQHGNLNVKQLINSNVSPKSVGVYFKSAKKDRAHRGFLEFDSEKVEAVMFTEGLWDGQMHELEKVYTARQLPGIGDLVKLKAGTYKDSYSFFNLVDRDELDNWRKEYVSKSVGVLRELKIVERGGVNMLRVPGEFVIIDFPEYQYVEHTYSDTDLADVTTSILQVDDRVRVNRNIPEPSRGWGGVTGSSIGKITDINFVDGQEEITIRFKNCKKWVGLPSDLETDIYPKVGGRVQVKLSRPLRSLWEGITHDHVGTLMDIDNIEDDDDWYTYQVAVVKFSGRKPLRCDLEWVEPVRYQPPDYDGDEELWQDSWCSGGDDYDSDYQACPLS